MTASMMMDQATDPTELIRAKVMASGTSFTVGMTLLPRARREAMYALYAFCREVDDIADDGPTFAARQAGLELWRERIKKLFNGQTEDPITQALLPAVHQFNLVPEDFLAIIDGMAMDAGEPIFAPTQTLLDLYCDRVASAVGRASVRIFGDSSPAAMQVSHHLGRALQLTNILRDLQEDARRNRLYLPREVLQRHGMAQLPLPQILRHVDLPRACGDVADMALEHFAEARAAMRQCKRSAMRPARIMGNYYHAILLRLIRHNWQGLSKRISLPLWQKIWLAMISL
jgi:presqualene diphosphate synthase